MFRNQKQRFVARGFTLRELLVTAPLVMLLVLMIAGRPIRQALEPVECAARLGGIGQAVAACFAEHNDYGPTHDDGEGPFGHTVYMFTWTDLLYDAGYLVGPRYHWCPLDRHPDYPPRLRGTAWNFRFVDHFGVNEPPKRGVRTSYALNFTMSMNFKQDRFEDAARQVYAMDGWWSWLGNLNAAWVLYEEVMGEPPPHPVDWPHWAATMQGWRHGLDHSANVLFVDGHVALLTPNVPDDLEGLLNDTVDTMQVFTWLPGERNLRLPQDPYEGEVPEYEGRRPYWVFPEEGTYKDVAGTLLPIDYPEELSCNWRTANDAWVKLPSDPEDRD
jgi:prepilin-type processing-associated H-X9-DG protein